VEINANIYERVWPEAAQLRKSGELLKIAEKIRCPVVAIHGDYDPHPANGVKEPLSQTIKDFRFILLKDCGHKPWIEKNTKDEFYRLLKQELE
ncbi:MAG TPA: alpha/beta hydrolase, partial [Pseudobdellovibrionaceae bacterium]|nr:alpha/beta hydrolase [Pseudobdellovibrionaceae bacterium]